MTGRVQEWQQEPQFHGQWDCVGQQFFGVIEESRKELRSPRLFIVMIRYCRPAGSCCRGVRSSSSSTRVASASTAALSPLIRAQAISNSRIATSAD